LIESDHFRHCNNSFYIDFIDFANLKPVNGGTFATRREKRRRREALKPLTSAKVERRKAVDGAQNARRSGNDRQNVAFAHQKEFVFAEFEVFAGVRQEEDAVAFLDGELAAFAIFENATVANADDDAARRFIFRGFRKVKAAGGLRFGFVATNDDAIAERLQFHTAAFFRRGFAALFLGHLELLRGVCNVAPLSVDKRNATRNRAIGAAKFGRSSNFREN
jgi:hypothetical protein